MINFQGSLVSKKFLYVGVTSPIVTSSIKINLFGAQHCQVDGIIFCEICFLIVVSIAHAEINQTTSNEIQIYNHIISAGF